MASLERPCRAGGRRAPAPRGESRRVGGRLRGQQRVRHPRFPCAPAASGSAGTLLRARRRERPASSRAREPRAELPLRTVPRGGQRWFQRCLRAFDSVQSERPSDRLHGRRTGTRRQGRCPDRRARSRNWHAHAGDPPPSGTPPSPTVFLTAYPRFVDNDTVAFFTYVDPDGSNPEHALTAFTVRIDGSGLKRVPRPVEAACARVISIFGVAQLPTDVMSLSVPGVPVNGGGGRVRSPRYSSERAGISLS